MSTCFGDTCLDMDELYDFLVQLKDLDLYNWNSANNVCCSNGQWADEGCNCYSGGEDREMRCIFSYCYNWKEVDGTIDYIVSQFTHTRTEWMLDNTAIEYTDNIMQDIAYTSMGIFGVLTAEGSNLLPDREGPMWTRVGQLAAITMGSLASYFSGVKALRVSIDTIGADPYGFARYGGNSFLGDFTGAFESIFSLLFMTIAIELAVAPLFLAYRMNKQLDSSVNIEQDMNNMWIMATVALGSFFGYFAIDEGVEHSIDFFNNFDTNPEFGPNFDEEFEYNNVSE